MQIYNYLHNYQNWVTYFRLPNLGNAVVWNFPGLIDFGVPLKQSIFTIDHRGVLLWDF